MPYVRLTSPAVDDLEELRRKDPALLREALKKCLLLERSAEAGEPLLGGLIGFRKLTVGDRHRRTVWRVLREGEETVIEIAEIWAVGEREDKAVYAEMNTRLAELGDDPRSVPLAEVIETLGRHAAGVAAQAEPVADPVPDWVRNGLLSAGANEDDIDAMSGADAIAELQRRWGSPPA